MSNRSGTIEGLYAIRYEDETIRKYDRALELLTGIETGLSPVVMEEYHVGMGDRPNRYWIVFVKNENKKNIAVKQYHMTHQFKKLIANGVIKELFANYSYGIMHYRVYVPVKHHPSPEE